MRSRILTACGALSMIGTLVACENIVAEVDLGALDEQGTATFTAEPGARYELREKFGYYERGGGSVCYQWQVEVEHAGEAIELKCDAFTMKRCLGKSQGKMKEQGNCLVCDTNFELEGEVTVKAGAFATPCGRTSMVLDGPPEIASLRLAVNKSQ